MEEIECFQTSLYKTPKPENHPKNRIQHSEQGASFEIKKSVPVFGCDFFLPSVHVT